MLCHYFDVVTNSTERIPDRNRPSGKQKAEMTEAPRQKGNQVPIIPDVES